MPLKIKITFWPVADGVWVTAAPVAEADCFIEAAKIIVRPSAVLIACSGVEPALAPGSRTPPGVSNRKKAPPDEVAKLFAY